MFFCSTFALSFRRRVMSLFKIDIILLVDAIYLWIVNFKMDGLKFIFAISRESSNWELKGQNIVVHLAHDTNNNQNVLVWCGITGRSPQLDVQVPIYKISYYTLVHTDSL